MNAERPAVLVVDDIEANLTAARGVLEGLDCEVAIARSGNEALRSLLRRRFSAMLLDVQMPEMDGYEVAQYARANPKTRDVPIIFLTAKHETMDDALRGYGTGAVDFLFKPISPFILRSKVRVFLELDQRRREVEQALRELQTTQAQLVQSAKLASLGELVAGVAHEINNPLAFLKSHLETVRANLSVLREDPGAGHAQGERWDKVSSRILEMERGLSRIGDLVLQLRTFSRLDEGEVKRVNVEECVASVLLILGHRLRDRIEVELRLEGPKEIECYAGPLNLLLLNLVSNAVDAIEQTGTIVISSRQVGADFELRVRDTGSGIASDALDRVFDPFFTTKPVGQGTGLGLAIGYSIAKKHRGTLSLTNANPGAEAVLRFPREFDQRTEA